MTLRNRFSPVLLVDDEYENISDLEELIRSAALRAGFKGEFVHYTESPEEAIERMREMMKSGGTYSAVISDNHMGGEIFGDDFLRIIMGKVGYCLSGHEDDLYVPLGRFQSFEHLMNELRGNRKDMLYFLDDNFGDIGNYRRFIEHYFGDKSPNPEAVLLCGNPEEANLTGLQGYIPIVQKDAREAYGKHCEREVLEILRARGIFEREHVAEALEHHHRLSPSTEPKKQSYNPCISRIRTKKEQMIARKHRALHDKYRLKKPKA